MTARNEGLRFVAEIEACRKAIARTLGSLQESFPAADINQLLTDLDMMNEVTPKHIPSWMPIEPLVRDWLDLRARTELSFMRAATSRAMERTDEMLDENVIRVNFTKKGPA